MLKLSDQQQQALRKITHFIDDKDKQIFVLKGYAGTGKTTMIKEILPVLQNHGKIVKLMAPTGRAAKILSEKTGYGASTIHKTIYQLSHLQDALHDEAGNKIKETLKNSERANGVDDFEFYFGIRPLEQNETPDRLVCIIDESSMISSRKASNETIHFGTDVLLDDLFTYGNPNKGAKYIFVGDPAQLPPVGDNKSAALDETHFCSIGLACDSFELTDVLRQPSGSAILSNAMKIRNLLGSDERCELAFDRVNGEVEDITSLDIIDTFSAKYPTPQLGSSVVICYSNAKVRDYNDLIRQRYFDDISAPHVGDVIQIVKNNHSYDLYNGDFAQITYVSDNLQTESAPVWANIGNERKRIVVELAFRDVHVLTYDGRNISCKIIESLLNNSHPGLTPIETTALYINFRMRHPEYKSSKEIQLGLAEDPYFNALCVKYGYAITCHKAQGGEWDTVYVDYQGRTGLNDDSLRWAYTATTRASHHLYGVLMPNLCLLDKLTINPISKTSKIAKDALKVTDMGEIESLPMNATNCQKAKYLSATKALSLIGCSISRVEFYQYVDRYYIVTTNGEKAYNLQYNGAGIYTSAKPLGLFDEDISVVDALMDDSEYLFNISYNTDSETLKKLYHMMLSYCDELDIKITNIAEASYQVIYHLKTDGIHSVIPFFYNAKKVITYAAPQSDLGEEDRKLQALICKLRK